MTKDDFPSNYLSPHPRHGVPRASFTYVAPLRAPSPLSVHLRVPAERVKNKYAHYVWNAGLLLADRIAAGELEVRGKRVLELGAGAGLPSLVAAKCGATEVVISDYDDEGMRSDLERNVRETLAGEEQARTRIVMHSWGTDPAKLKALGPFDLVLLADVVWDVPMHEPLLQSLANILSETTEVSIVVGYHTGRPVVRSFFAAAADAGLELIDRDGWEEVSVDGEMRRFAWEAGFEEERESQEERARWVLEGRMRLARRTS